MGLSASLILIAVGAILTWAVTADVNGLNVQTVGVILMVVGIAGALISFIFWSSWGGFGGYRRDVVVRDRDQVITALDRTLRVRRRGPAACCPRPGPPAPSFPHDRLAPRSRSSSDGVAVSLSGELDAYDAPALRATFAELAARIPARPSCSTSRRSRSSTRPRSGRSSACCAACARAAGELRVVLPETAARRIFEVTALERVARRLAEPRAALARSRA